LERRLKRGEIWTATGGAEYASKPRAVVILQHENFDFLNSVTVCGFTSNPTDLPLFRILIEPSKLNALRLPSRIMADKILTIRKAKLARRIGRLSNQDMTRLNRAIATFLGLAD
jgi:mRNA interferase MazF